MFPSVVMPENNTFDTVCQVSKNGELKLEWVLK